MAFFKKTGKKLPIKTGFAVIKRTLLPHKRDFWLVIVLSVITAGADSFIPYVSGKLFDSILRPAADIILAFSLDIPKVFLFLGLWLVLRLISDAMNWQKSARQEKLEAVIDADYIIHAYSKLIELPLSFHKTRRMGEVTNRIYRGSSWIVNIISRLFIDLLPQFLSIVFALFIVFFIRWQLFLVIFVSIILYIILLSRTAPKLSVISYQMHKSYNQAYGYANDVILNVQSVKQSTAEKYERKKFFHYFHTRAAGLWTRYMQVRQMLNLYQKIIVTAMQFGIFLYSIFLIRKGLLTPGELVAFNAYAAMVVGPFVILGRNWDLVQNGFVAIERAEKVISREPEKYEPDSAVVVPEINGAIEFQNVSFHYPGKKELVLKDVSFKIEPGRTLALVGESGVGKSTIADLISFYFKPTLGRILIDGHNVKNFNLKMLRQNIAVVPQEILLFNDTIRQNIRYGSPEAGDDDMVAAAQKAYADNFIRNFPKKYEQMVGERGIKLSTGQKQRIAISRAILRNPKILILDEPTSALDAKSENFIQKCLDELMVGRTTIVIAHRLSTIRKADMILVLDKGRVAESGKHEDLLKIPGGIYRKLYDLQIGFH